MRLELFRHIIRNVVGIEFVEILRLVAAEVGRFELRSLAVKAMRLELFRHIIRKVVGIEFVETLRLVAAKVGNAVPIGSAAAEVRGNLVIRVEVMRRIAAAGEEVAQGGERAPERARTIEQRAGDPEKAAVQGVGAQRGMEVQPAERGAGDGSDGLRADAGRNGQHDAADPHEARRRAQNRLADGRAAGRIARRMERMRQLRFLLYLYFDAETPTFRKKGGRFSEARLLGFVLDLDYLLAIIIATGLAHAVRKLHFSALGALHDARERQLPVRGTTGISSRLRNFSFRCCHGHTSS